MELKEDASLAAQNIQFDGLVQEVHCSSLITPETALAVGASCGQKDDWDASGALGPPHKLGEFKTIHIWHLDVEQRQGDVILEKEFQGVVAGPSLQAEEPLTAKQAFQRQKVFFQIIDQQKMHGPSFGRHVSPTSRKYAAISVKDRTLASLQAWIAARGIAAA